MARKTLTVTSTLPQTLCQVVYHATEDMFYGICLYLQNWVFSMYFRIRNNSTALIPANAMFFFPPLWFLLSNPKCISALLQRPGIWGVSIKLACDLPPEAQVLRLLEDGNFTLMLSAPEPALKALFSDFFLNLCSSALYRRVAQPRRARLSVGRIPATFCL